MIRPLRLAHRRIFLALSVFLPLVFVVGIAARKAPAIMDMVPSVLVSAPRHSTPPLWERGDLFPGVPVVVKLFRETATGRFSITCSAGPTFAKPDVLVYWCPKVLPGIETLPNNAVFLGPLDAQSLTLPGEKNRSGTDVLVLFSLADNEVLATSQPFPTL